MICKQMCFLDSCWWVQCNWVSCWGYPQHLCEIIDIYSSNSDADCWKSIWFNGTVGRTFLTVTNLLINNKQTLYNYFECEMAAALLLVFNKSNLLITHFYKVTRIKYTNLHFTPTFDSAIKARVIPTHVLIYTELSPLLEKGTNHIKLGLWQ